MANSWHVECLKAGVESWNLRRSRLKIVPNLSGLRFFDCLPPDYRDSPKASKFFEKINLSDANLEGADLSGLNFSRAKFKRANLSRANLSASNFSNASFEMARLDFATLDRAIISGAKFIEASINTASFQYAEAKDAIFVESELLESQRKDLSAFRIQVYASRIEYDARFSRFGDLPPQPLDLPPLPHVAHRLEEASILDLEFIRDYPFETASEVASAESIDPAKTKPRKERYNVFFGTNRGKIIQRGSVVDFDGKRQADMSFGICEVLLPATRRVGTLGGPWWRKLLGRDDDQILIENLIPLDSNEFWQKMSELGRRTKLPERPTIFVHGYNHNFRDSVLRAAQLGFDLGIGKGIGLFSWASRGKFYSYKTDEATVDASKYFLADFIEKFVNFTNSEVNIIAHSMGCRCVMGALERLGDGRTHILKKVNQVILAAADIDTGQMPMLASHAVGNARRTTSYISDRDAALKVSGWMHSFPRVGVMPPPFILSGMDTVLVNDLDLGLFSHSYVGTSRSVLSDIFSVLSSNLDPSERFSVESISMNGHSFWKIRN